jgi:alanine racemase
MRFKELAGICPGEVLQLFEDLPVQTLLIDSRKAVISRGSVFFALKGERFDGHQFLDELYRNGIRQFVVERKVNVASFKDANIFLVKSSIECLHAIARHHREQFDLPVIGITGSNGKTIIKEWLFQVLSPHLQIIKNPGSYNSQVGVPLSVWQVQAQHDLGIFEAGISKPGEMEKLQAIIKPTIGIFANLGSAHDEGFISREQKADEKTKLFEGCEAVICCNDHALILSALEKKGTTCFTWSLSGPADVMIEREGPSKYRVASKKEIFTLHLPFSDHASVENALHVLTYMLYQGYKSSVVTERLWGLTSVPMRLELKQGINRCIIIDDSYNNDLAGLQISLDFLKTQQKSRKAIILSDVLQSGLVPEELMKHIRDITSPLAPLRGGEGNRFIGIGPIMYSHQQLFPGGQFYQSTGDFLADVDPNDFADEVILVKGARPFQFEKIVQRLQRKVHGTVMEVDLDAMVHNLNYFKSQLRPGTKIMAMVKAFAYGSGSEEVANLLQYHRIDYLGVAYVDEGIELRKNNISLPIMVMNPTEESFESMVEHGLEPEIYSPRILNALIGFLSGRACRIHLKIDTGMHRLGFEESDVKSLIGILKANRNLSVASIFSHLSGADARMHDEFSHQQAKRFSAIADQIEKELGVKPIRHLLNSPGILRLRQYQFDMVRLGIGLYGVDPTEDGKANLKPVPTLKTVISQIREVEAHESVGYGRKGIATKRISLATIAIGYADGYSRAFSNGKGKVLVNDKLAPVMGNVCMDMTMVDVSGIDAHEGDEVTIFGPGLPINQVAQWIETIPYELLTSTSERVKRVFYAGSL